MHSPEFVLPDPVSDFRPRLGLVLGSGLGDFVASLEDASVIPYAAIDGLPVSGVPGHAGELHLGSIGGVEIAVARGRVHLYEGWSAREVSALVRLFHQMGAENLVLTNAAGIVNPDFHPGEWMLIRDHLNLARQSPLTGSAQFVDQTAVYSGRLRGIFQKVATDSGGEPLREGVYAWVNGPEYETPAEIRMLGRLDADAVGMSTVPEAIQARALGLEVAALSCLTNYGAGISGEPLSHEEVIEVGHRTAGELFALLERVVPRLGDLDDR